MGNGELAPCYLPLAPCYLPSCHLVTLSPPPVTAACAIIAAMTATTSNDKVIHSFADRLALERAVQALGEAPNAYELERRARELAAKGSLALNALLRHLDASTPTLRGGLGLLAQSLDRDLVVPALHRAAADPLRSATARLTAVMILERYLGESIDPSLTPALPDPAQVARQSAEEALALAAGSPLVLAEYVIQLLAEPPEVIYAVIDVLSSLESPQRARLLMAIASYAPAAIAERTLPHLNAIRHPAALESLRILRHLAPPGLQPACDRQARKLQLAGVRAEASLPDRCLWSPTSAQGHSQIWIIHREDAAAGAEGGDYAGLLALGLHDDLGVTRAETAPHLPLDGLPMPAPRGYVHRLRIPNSAQVVHLAEIDPALGLALVNRVVAAQRAKDLAWPPELIGFGVWLWGAEMVASIAPAWPALPAPATDARPDAFVDLLRHPAFSAWAWEISDLPSLLAHQREGPHIREGGAAHRAIARRLVADENARLLAQRLEQQAQWLALTGDEATAALTLAAGAAIQSGQAEHPFVWALSFRSLLTAAADRAAQQALRFASDRASGMPSSVIRMHDP